MFDKSKDMYKLQKQAKAIRNQLKSIHIEADADDLVKVVVSGEFELIDLNLLEKAATGMRDGSVSKKDLEEALKKALNKALKKAQEISSAQTKDIFQSMGMGM